MIFKVAILQMRSINRAKVRNTELIISKMQEAAMQKADILLLPECFITGYELPIANSEALRGDDICITQIAKAAKEYNIGVVATALTEGKLKPQNSAFVIDKDGKILMKYAKVHTCDFADERCIESGEAFKVCDFEGVKLGIMICYDREYPESARVLMLKGAEIILVPNDCGAMQPRINALSTRAYENMVGIAMANPNGENAGCSCAYSPICWDKEGKCVDNTIVLANDLEEGLFFAEFDMEQIRNYRAHEMMGNTFRKVKAYSDLLSKEIKAPFIRENQLSTKIIYTGGENKDFIQLCYLLDEYLNEIAGGEKQRSQYVQYNTLEDIHDVVVLYSDEEAVGCGSFKFYKEGIAEVKRVYLKESYRGRGLGKTLMLEVEKHAKEKGYKKLILETGKPLIGAMRLYERLGYKVISNYGQYKDMKESICMEKEIL